VVTEDPWVAVEPLTDDREMQAFYSTCHEATAE
jgi:hypothetical protein